MGQRDRERLYNLCERLKESLQNRLQRPANVIRTRAYRPSRARTKDRSWTGLPPIDRHVAPITTATRSTRIRFSEKVTTIVICNGERLKVRRGLESA